MFYQGNPTIDGNTVLVSVLDDASKYCLNLRGAASEIVSQALKNCSLIDQDANLKKYPIAYIIIDNATVLSEDHINFLKEADVSLRYAVQDGESLDNSQVADLFKDDSEFKIYEKNAYAFFEAEGLSYEEYCKVYDQYRDEELKSYGYESNENSWILDKLYEALKGAKKSYLATSFLLFTLVLVILLLAIMLTPGALLALHALLVVPPAAWYNLTVALFLIGLVGRLSIQKGGVSRKTAGYDFIMASALLLMVCYMLAATSSAVLLLGAIAVVPVLQVATLITLIVRDKKSFIDNKRAAVEWMNVAIPAVTAVIMFSVVLSSMWAQAFLRMSQPNPLLWAEVLIALFLCVFGAAVGRYCQNYQYPGKKQDGLDEPLVESEHRSSQELKHEPEITTYQQVVDKILAASPQEKKKILSREKGPVSPIENDVINMLIELEIFQEQEDGGLIRDPNIDIIDCLTENYLYEIGTSQAQKQVARALMQSELLSNEEKESKAWIECKELFQEIELFIKLNDQQKFSYVINENRLKGKKLFDKSDEQFTEPVVHVLNDLFCEGIDLSNQDHHQALEIFTSNLPFGNSEQQERCKQRLVRCYMDCKEDSLESKVIQMLFSYPEFCGKIPLETLFSLTVRAMVDDFLDSDDKNQFFSESQKMKVLVCQSVGRVLTPLFSENSTLSSLPPIQFEGRKALTREQKQNICGIISNTASLPNDNILEKCIATEILKHSRLCEPPLQDNELKQEFSRSSF